MTVLARNKKARFENFILDTFEAGIVLVGSEVKSVSGGHISLVDSFATIIKGEVWLRNCHITPYEKGSYFNVSALRDRKLLLHRREIDRLIGKLKEQSVSLVPLSVYYKNNRIKVELALVKGKKLHDKKQVLRERDIIRSLERELS